MMKINATFLNGHLIDDSTKKKLNFVHGASYTIEADDGSIRYESDILKIDNPRNTKAQESWILEKHKGTKVEKILHSGDQLFFRVGTPRRQEWDKDHYYIFTCHLLEDLYVYLVKGKMGDDRTHWRLSDCKVQLLECLHGQIATPFSLSAESLNGLYIRTSQFFFPFQNCGSANAFDVFHLYDPLSDRPITNEGIYHGLYEKLNDIRMRIAASYFNPDSGYDSQ
jgi:hypothetical protein